ncbi:hypothetical protein [Streptomyces sp. NPDC017890]|uniref:hypothetical protein n=1 Tax=Streptomyces sp. NPDC017890 TaxID=3365015 RepID=UPI0037B54A8A
MARHASSSRTPAVRRALVVLATTGAALGAGAVTASAEGGMDPQPDLRAVTGTVGHVTGPVADLKPNPLAGTGVDPLDNGVGTQVADFQPLTSTALTGPVAQARSVGGVPVVGRAAELLR